MALLSIAEAAHLARRNHADLYRDVDDGRLQARRTADGELLLDTEELWRVYGRTAIDTAGASQDQMKIAVLEERTRALERALALEAELRRVKDQVANELRARLADKDNVIKVLESKILFLEYDKQVASLPLEDATDIPRNQSETPRPARPGHGGWWSRLLGRHGDPARSKDRSRKTS